MKIKSNEITYDENNNIFADNPDDRCPFVLVADTSYSMSGHRINALNKGIKELYNELNTDVLCKRRIDLSIVKCGGTAEVIQPMITIQDICDGQIPEFQASGGTPMDESLNHALDQVESRKAELNENRIKYYKPLIVIITDGQFDLSDKTKARLHQSENANGHRILPIGVGKDADAQSLANTSVEGLALLLDDVDFGEIIEFLSSSLKSVSNSSPGQEISIVPPEKIQVIKL